MKKSHLFFGGKTPLVLMILSLSLGFSLLSHESKATPSGTSLGVERGDGCGISGGCGPAGNGLCCSGTFFGTCICCHGEDSWGNCILKDSIAPTSGGSVQNGISSQAPQELAPSDGETKVEEVTATIIFTDTTGALIQRRIKIEKNRLNNLLENIEGYGTDPRNAKTGPKR